MSGPSNLSLLADNPIHVNRWAKHHAGKTIQEIAAEDGIKESAVRKSIHGVQAWMDLNNKDAVEKAQIATILECSKDRVKAIKRALNAKQKIRNHRGALVEVIEDHDTQLRAIEQLGAMEAQVNPPPKVAPQQTLNVGIANSPPPPTAATAITGAMSFEETLREIQARRQNLLPPASTMEYVAPPKEDSLEAEIQP